MAFLEFSAHIHEAKKHGLLQFVLRKAAGQHQIIGLVLEEPNHTDF